MFRLFDMLGRSTAIRAIDDALRAAGMHPVLVPDPVKLTVLQLHKKLAPAKNQEDGFADSAQMLAYCILGHEQFATSNSTYDAQQLAQRMEAALDDGDTLDAKLILLALHAGLIAPEIADQIDIDNL